MGDRCFHAEHSSEIPRQHRPAQVRFLRTLGAGDESGSSPTPAEVFRDLEGTFDQATTRYLTGIGLGAGWHCWEAAAGGGSIARWIAERVGPAGSVFATDLNVDALTGPVADNIRLSRHDLSLDEAPDSRFDLVHARLVLSSLPDRDQIVRRLARALRPGGWLVLEEFCSAFHRGSDPSDEDDALFREVEDALMGVLVERGSDFGWATALPQRLRILGLHAVGAEGRLIRGRGGSPAARLIASTLRQFEQQIVDSGTSDKAAISGAFRLLSDPEFTASLPLLISAWGRREE